MSRYNIPDHPVIRSMEKYGTPDGKDPVYPKCPICGEDCCEVYIRDEEIVGCDVCIECRDAQGFEECYPQKGDYYADC